MATYNIGNRKHLTLADRAAIEHGIQIGENFSQIARKLNKDSSTISKRYGVISYMFLIIRMTSRRNARNASSFIPVTKEMYVATFPAGHCALSAVLSAVPCFYSCTLRQAQKTTVCLQQLQPDTYLFP